MSTVFYPQSHLSQAVFSRENEKHVAAKVRYKQKRRLLLMFLHIWMVLGAKGKGGTFQLHPGQSSLSAEALRYRAWAHSWSSTALAARSVLPSNRPATPLYSTQLCEFLCALGEARPGQSSLSAGALRYRAWAQSWSSAALAARSVLPSNWPATPLYSPACWELGFQAWAQSTCPVVVRSSSLTRDQTWAPCIRSAES